MIGALASTAEPALGVVDAFLAQGVLGSVILALGGAIIYLVRDAKAERDAARAALAQSEQGRLLEAQARVADAKEMRQFMTDFQKGEATTINSLETIAENLVRVTEDLRRATEDMRRSKP